MSRTPDTTQCPVCGEPYDQRIVVERGARWDDLFPGTPLDFFRRYRRRCAAQYDVEREKELQGDERAVYFHDDESGAAVF